jgi:hypothetical protein
VYLELFTAKSKRPMAAAYANDMKPGGGKQENSSKGIDQLSGKSFLGADTSKMGANITTSCVNISN